MVGRGRKAGAKDQSSGQNRNSHGGGSDDPDNDLTLGMGSIIAVAILLLGFGAVLQTAYMVSYHPNCSTQEGSKTAMGNVRTGAVSSPQVGNPSPKAAEESVAQLPTDPSKAIALLEATIPAGSPPACTADQMIASAKRIPRSGCFEQPYTQQCAFTIMTRGCQNPKFMREFYVNEYNGDANVPFLGVMVGWSADDTPNDTLYIGSRDPKYESKRSHWDKGCKNEIPVPTDRGVHKAQVLVVEWDDNNRQKVEGIKKEFSYTDEEILLDGMNPQSSPDYTLSTQIQSHFPGEDRPIHYMAISRGLDFTILMKQLSSDVLKNVRYLTFGYNWKGDWGDGAASLSPVIDRLKNEGGLACYWAGDVDHEGFWRITDCFLSHYRTKHWSNIACVSTRHDDVATLKNRMEASFLHSLATTK